MDDSCSPLFVCAFLGLIVMTARLKVCNKLK